MLEAYVNGVSTRKVDRLVEQLGIEGMTRILALPQEARPSRGVQLVSSDDHEGLKAAIARVLASVWQRCTVHCVPGVRAPDVVEVMAA